MCGIAGRLNLDGEAVAPALLDGMCRVLRHRGPDDRSTHAAGPVGLAHTRLSILDLSQAGRQPMSNADGTLWIVYNGEIYNFLELRAELEGKGYRFTSQTDTEVILYLYEEYGEQCVARLAGMFALAIWDARRKRLFLARDRVGKKPLYYYRDARCIVFGSELKAILLDSRISRKVRDDALCDFLTYGFVPDPKSIFEGIHKLLPGHYMIVGPDGDRTEQYWDLQFSEGPTVSENARTEQLLESLTDAVSCRLISDVPLGAFLSGGVDSGAVVALMAQLERGEVITSSIGFEEEAFNELEHARVVAELFKTKHHEDTVRYDAFERILEILLWHFEEPFCDESAIATYYLSKLARKHVTVALSGDGGDEAFGGYSKYANLLQEESWRRRLPGSGLARSMLPLLRSRALAGLGHNVARAANFVESATVPRDLAIHLANGHLREHEAAGLFNAGFRRRLADYSPAAIIQEYYRKADTDDFLAAVLYVDTKFLLPGDFLVKVDRMSMASSLEVRSPFLDHRVLEFAATLPSDCKIRDGEKKYILKKALATLLPHEVLYRKKKGFDVPIGQWFVTTLKDYVERELLESGSVLAEYFEPSYVKRLWTEFLAGRTGHKSLIWNLLMFKIWHKKWIGHA